MRASQLNVIGTGLTLLTLIFAIGAYTTFDASLSLAMTGLTAVVQLAAMACFYVGGRRRHE